MSTEYVAQEHTIKAIHELLSKEPDSKQTTAKQAFILCTQEKLFTLNDLLSYAEHMSPEVFAHHVREEQNDFAVWIRDVHNNQELADIARSATTPKELFIALQDHCEALPSIQETTSVLTDPEDVVSLREHFARLRDEINQEIDESISLLRSQADRIRLLRDELRTSEESLKEQEALLREEIRVSHQQQEELSEEIASLKQANKELSGEREEAAKVQQAVLSIRDELREKNDSLIQAREYLREQLQKTNSSQPTTPPKRYTPSASHVQELVRLVYEDVQAGRLSAAKQGYADARASFYEAELSESQRQELYQQLMDAYTRIHLQGL
ncbi:MAG: hypothetical protein ACMXYD_01965 [Candidatus Woesearchaeota archaeon]